MIDTIPITVPTVEFLTQACWINISPWFQPKDQLHENESGGISRLVGVNSQFTYRQLRYGIHGLNHLIANLFPFFILCDRSDVDTEHFTTHEERKR